MTTLEIKVNLPERLAREAKDAGLLTPASLSKLLKEAMRHRAAQALLTGAHRATKAGSKPMTLETIQTEINAVRRARKTNKRA